MARKTRSSSKRTPAIPRASFERLVREISQNLALEGDKPVLWSAEAMDALHEESEVYLAEHFQNANVLCDTFKKKTLDMRHFNTAKNLSVST